MKILMIGAHQDDNEFRCGGLAYKLKKLGHDVQFLSLCNGCGGHHIMSPAETTARRATESAAVAKLLGIKYDVWDIDDCNIVADLATRKRLIRYIRNYSPDILITHRSNDYHADHRNAAVLVQDASYLLIVPGFCPEVPAMRVMPTILYCWDRFLQPPFRTDVVIGIDEVIDKKFEMFDCHVSQVYEWLPYSRCIKDQVPETPEERLKWLKGGFVDRTLPPDDQKILSEGIQPHSDSDEAWLASCYREKLVERYGEAGKRIHFAEAFGACEYGTPLTEESARELFPF